jgi:hypothetical protein
MILTDTARDSGNLTLALYVTLGKTLRCAETELAPSPSVSQAMEGVSSSREEMEG